ncbi:uncharacterized protein [Watersipora subatra]|uniref:uncharacterized protein n=1 Tax=Watersipora subatra TaxID=2589382 RepID=UPI00355B3406
MNPTFNNPMTNSIHVAMEDLTLSQKQLPFRQQRDKPLLKYSNSEPGPIYLYQNPDLENSSLNTAPNSAAKSLASKKALQPVHPTQYNPTQYTYVPPPDPYARPLSAKDLMTVGLERTKSLNHMMGATLAGNIALANSMHGTNINNSTLFLPPKNSEISDSGEDSVAPNTPISNLSQRMMATTRVVSVQSPEANTIRTKSAKEKFEASLSKPPTSDHGARPPSSLRRPQSSTVRNPNYTPSKPYDDCGSVEDEDFKMLSDSDVKFKRKQDDNLNNKVSKAINSLTRTATGIKINSVTKLSSSNESLTEKPSDQKLSLQKPQSAESLQSRVESDMSNLSIDSRGQNRVLSGTENISHSNSSKKVERVDSATSYYLKSSKPEVKIAEPRPACEGRDCIVTETSKLRQKKSASTMLAKPSPTSNFKTGSGKTVTSRPVSSVQTILPAADNNSTRETSSSSSSPQEEFDENESDSAFNLSERIPGDGEADAEFDEEDDDCIDGFEDDELEEPDDGKHFSKSLLRHPYNLYFKQNTLYILP